MAFAEKRGKGKSPWRVRYKLPSGDYESASGFETKALALQHGRDMETDVRRRVYLDPDAAATPVGVWAREWMVAQEPRGQTVSTRWGLLDTHILPRWESTPLIDVNWFDAEAWANRVALSHDDVTAAHALTLLSQIMTGAVDKKKIHGNPLAGRKRRRTAKVKAKNQAKEQRKAAQARAVAPELVLRVARRAGRRDGLHILTTAFTGLRWNEGLALTRDSLGERRELHWGGEWVCPVLQLRQGVAEYQPRDPATGKKLPMFIGLEPLKNDGSVRGIDLPPFLAELLRVHIASMPKKHDYLFCTKGGKWWRNSNFGRQVMRPVCDGREALPVSKGHPAREAWPPIVPGWTMDFARHTHDSYQSEIDVAEPLAFEQAGHRRPGIKATYQHPTVEMRKQRLDGLQTIFERGMAVLGWETVWETESERPIPLSQKSPKRSSKRGEAQSRRSSAA